MKTNQTSVASPWASLVSCHRLGWLGAFLAGILTALPLQAAVSFDPPTRNFTKDGGGAAIIVTAGAAEAWTATTTASWLNISPTTSGTGSGTVAYLVSANFSADTRVGTIVIGGSPHTVTQTGYPSTLNPASATFNLAGGSGQITVTVEAGIAWSAVPDQTWVKVVSGGTGFGSGTVNFTADPYSDVATRFANVSVAGKIFTVSQTGTDVILSPKTWLAQAQTTVLTVTVRALSTTAWAVVPDVDWLFPIGASSGSGDGTVTLGIAENASWGQRFGTLRIGSAILTVGQAGKAEPVYAIDPLSVTASAFGASGGIGISATLDAPWSLTSSVPWLNIVAGGSGAGNGLVQYVVSQNPYVTNRVGTLEFAGAAPQPAPDLMRDALFHYPFNGGLVSYMNNAQINNADGTGGPIFTNSRAGNPDGQAIYFANTYTRYVDFNPAGRTRAETTYAFWFNVDWDNRVNRLLALEGTGSTTVKVYTEADGRLRCDGPGGNLVSSAYIQKGQWYHLMLRQTTAGVELWLNGAVVASAAYPNQLPQGNNRARLGGGGSVWGTANFYQGKIDEFRCWDRALSDPELTLLYNTELEGTSARIYNVAPPTAARSDGRLAHYRFENNNLDSDQFGRAFAEDSGFAGWAADRFGRTNSAAARTIRVHFEDRFHESTTATHCFWVKWNSLGAQTVFLKERHSIGEMLSNYPAYETLALERVDSNNLRIAWRKEAKFSGFNGPYSTQVIASGNVEKTFVTARWYHITISGDITHVTVYVDGAAHGTFPMSGFPWGKIPNGLVENTVLNGTTVNFGDCFLGAGKFAAQADAVFDDYQIYDRVLTAAEIAQKYNAERPNNFTHTVTQAGAVGVLSAASTNVVSAGGAGSVSLTIGSAAVWTVASDSAWLTFSGGGSGTGNGTVSYTVAANTSINSRMGRLTIAELTYTVNQAGRSVTTTGGGPFSFGPDGGSASFSIASENNAAWTVLNTNAWITVASGASGTAPASCIFIVSPYGSPLVARSGFLTVGSNVITVSQSGYTSTVSPSASTLAANGGSQSVTVTVPPGAIWSALAQVPWITVIGGQAQNGSGTLTYLVDGNVGGSRSGQIVVAGQTVVITQNAATAGAIVELRPGSAASRTGNQVLIPVTAAGFTNIQSAQFTVKWDTSAMDYVGVEQFGLPALGAANFGSPTVGVLTFSWEHPSLDSTTLATNTALFAVRFNLTGTPGSSSEVRIESTPTLLELVDVAGSRKVATSTRGTVSIINAFDLLGQIKYGDTAIPVTNVTVTITGDLSQTFQSGASNGYALAVADAGNVNIAVSKQDDTSPSRGVSTADIVAIRRHILALSPFSTPYKLIAADANASGTITTADITSLRRLILGQTNSLPAGMWRIIPATYAFPIPSQPYNAPNYRSYYSVRGSYTGQDYIAIKIGDVENSWTNGVGTVTPQGFAPAGGPGAGVQLLVTSCYVRPGGEGQVAVKVGAPVASLAGVQFSLRWNPALFSLVGLTNVNLIGFGAGNLGTGRLAEGILTFSWDDTQGRGVALAAGESLFSVVLRSTGSSGISSVRIEDSPTPRELVLNGSSVVPGVSAGTIAAVDFLPAIANPILGGEKAHYFRFLKDPSLSYEVQESDDLASWRPARNGVISTLPDGTCGWSVQPESGGNVSSGRFYRLKVTQPQSGNGATQ